jgi:putative DNA primase/helicase
MTGKFEIESIITYFKEIEPKKTEWLWPERIPLGTLTFIVGEPNRGKTFLTMFIAARVSTGSFWPDRIKEKQEAGSVIILTAEDDLNRAVRVRLEAAGADLSRVATISMDIIKGDEKQRLDIFNLTHYLEVLEQAIAKMGNVRLVIIDPITAYMGGKDSNSNTQVREFLAPLAKLAEKYNVAIIGISHFNKKLDIAAAYRTIGSVGFRAAARAVWVVLLDPDDKDRRLFLPDKVNLAKEPTGLAFRLVDTQVTTDDGLIDTAFCEFESAVIYKTADEVLRAEHSNLKGVSRIKEATEWLKGILSNGPMPANNVKELAKFEGIKERTLERAKEKLGIMSEPVFEGGKFKGWVWSLPEQKHESAQES